MKRDQLVVELHKAKRRGSFTAGVTAIRGDR